MGMIPFDPDSARETVANLGLAPSNRALAEYWLSLWRGGALPRRGDFEPAELKSLLRNLIILDVVPDRSVKVRLAGSTFNVMLGIELTGLDWIALAPAEYRADRLRILSDIAVGAIGRGIRRIEMEAAEDAVCEELLLPFAPDGSSDICPVFCRLDWKPRGDHVKIRSREQAMGSALAFETVALLHMERNRAIGE